MAYRLIDNSIYLHTPRTGGTFVAAVLRKLDCIDQAIGRKHDCPGVVPIDMTVPHHVFIRHPYKWIRSVYSFQYEHGWPEWPKNSPADRWWHPFREIRGVPARAREDFDAFLIWLANERPGFVTTTFMKFADWPNAIIYDTDNMQEDLYLMLASIGVSPEVAEAAIESVEAERAPRNTFPFPDDAGPEALDLFQDSEATAYRRFGYAPLPIHW